jgi:hypothetical protein
MHRFFQSGEKYKKISKWSCCDGQPAQMENYQVDDKYKDFSKWFDCNGLSAQMKGE